MDERVPDFIRKIVGLPVLSPKDRQTIWWFLRLGVGLGPDYALRLLWRMWRVGEYIDNSTNFRRDGVLFTPKLELADWRRLYVESCNRYSVARITYYSYVRVAEQLDYAYDRKRREGFRVVGPGFRNVTGGWFVNGVFHPFPMPPVRWCFEEGSSERWTVSGSVYGRRTERPPLGLGSEHAARSLTPELVREWRRPRGRPDKRRHTPLRGQALLYDWAAGTRTYPRGSWHHVWSTAYRNDGELNLPALRTRYWRLHRVTPMVDPVSDDTAS